MSNKTVLRFSECRLIVNCVFGVVYVRIFWITKRKDVIYSGDDTHDSNKFE